MTEKELLKIAASLPTLTDDEISDNIGEEDINEMCEEALLQWEQFKTLNNSKLSLE